MNTNIKIKMKIKPNPNSSSPFINAGGGNVEGGRPGRGWETFIPGILLFN